MREASYKLSLLITLTVCAAWFGGGCAASRPAFDGIANRGIVPVSAQTPYVGSNVFLSEEMEHSGYLYDFIHKRGAPQAIELIGSSELNCELLLFYSKEMEYYSAVPLQDSVTKLKEWIIRGPSSITREQYPHVIKLVSDRGAIFEVFGKREVVGGPGRAEDSRFIKPAFIPTPQPAPTPVKRKPKKRVAQPSNPASTPLITGTPTPSNFDQQALSEARRTPTAAVVAPLQPSPSPVAQASPVAKTRRPTLGDALQSAILSTPETKAATPQTAQ